MFHRLLQITAVNSWILFKQFKKKEISLIYFLIPLAAQLIEIGKSGAKNVRKASVGRPSKRTKFMTNISQSKSKRCADVDIAVKRKFKSEHQFYAIRVKHLYVFHVLFHTINKPSILNANETLILCFIRY